MPKLSLGSRVIFLTSLFQINGGTDTSDSGIIVDIEDETTSGNRDTPFRCNYCSIGYRHSAYLMDHMINTHVSPVTGKFVKDKVRCISQQVHRYRNSILKKEKAITKI